MGTSVSRHTCAASEGLKQRHCPKKCHLMLIVSHKCSLPKKAKAVPTFSGAVSSKDSFVDSSWTFGKTSSLEGDAAQDRLPKHVEGSPSLKGLKKLHSISSSVAGAGCWARLWGCLPAGVFVIFFNILSSFYWSGKYLVLTSYKSRLFLSLR